MEAFDPFAMFGLPRRFEIDTAHLQREYLRLSAELHPDVTSDEYDAGEKSAALNRAKQVLDDPEQRAVALWRLLGGSGAGGGGGGEDKSLPPGFLMEMMEVREELELAQRSGDPAALAKWEAWAEQRRKEHQASVGALFRACETAAAPAALKQIKQQLNAWRYVERMMEQM